MEIGASQSGKEIPENEIVQLDQEFTLFDSERILIRKHEGAGEIPRGQILSVKSAIELGIPMLQNIPLMFEARFNTTLHRYFGVTPFDLEIGYAVSPEDFDVESRTKKLFDLRKRRVEKIGAANPVGYIEPRASLSLNMVTRNDRLGDLGITMPGASEGRLKPGVLEILQGIDLALIFPKSAWKGVPEKGEFYFFYFHPSNTPVLAIVPERTWDEGGAMHKGISLFVPDDLDKLSLIKGIFSRRS